MEHDNIPEVVLSVLISCAVTIMAIGGISWWFNRRLARRKYGDTGFDKDDPRAVAMPVEFVKAVPRRVADLAVGETAWISAVSVDVNTHGHAFVQENSKLEPQPAAKEPGRGDTLARIERVSHGLVLTLARKHDVIYERKPLLPSLKYLPVVRIVVEEDGQ